jgi:hypothetical protein
MSLAEASAVKHLAGSYHQACASNLQCVCRRSRMGSGFSCRHITASHVSRRFPILRLKIGSCSNPVENLNSLLGGKEENLKRS